MKIWKKTMMLAMCIALSAGITACGTNGNDSTSQTSSVTAPTSESTPESTAPESTGSEEGGKEEEKTVYYSITFKQDGEKDVVKKVEEGKALTSIPNPKAKTGYTVAWDVTDFSNLTADMTVNAVATPNAYTVTYDANGGTVASATAEFTFDAAYTLAEPTKDGYTFAGWMNGETPVAATGTWTTASNVTLVATWTANTYTVTYDANGGTVADATADVVYGSAYTLAEPTKAGYTFAGWMNGETPVAATGNWAIAENVTLVAAWTANTYTVTYDANGGTVASATAEVTFGDDYTLAEPTKAGYTFAGWMNGETPITATGKWAIAENVTLVATWTANTYKVTFDADGGKVDMEGASYTYGSEYSLPTPKKDDYNFVAWTYKGNAVDMNGKWAIAEDVTLVATWAEKDKCVIIFQQEGYDDIKKEVIIGNELKDIPAPAEKEGYTIVWDTTDFSKIEGNMTVKAVATANKYTVKYDANGGAAGKESDTFVFDAEYMLAEAKCIGYKFLGWEINGELVDMKGDAWKIAKDVTAVAKWQKIHTVTFVQEGCENIVKEVLDGEALKDIPQVTEKTGYTIVWEDADFSKIGNDMTIKAIATANGYVITYNANGGTATKETQDVTFDAEYTVAEATREGYTFGGWYIEGTDTKVEGGVWTMASDVTLVAKWNIVEGEYSMKYNFNVTDEKVTQITKKAYAGGSKVTFKYYIPAGTTTGWWGIAWHTDPTKADNYHTAGIKDAIGYISLSTATGEWLVAEFTLPEGGEYYLYFGSEFDGAKWQLDGANSYALIDDFKIGDTVENFNKGIDESIFAENVPGGISVGDGYVKPVISGEYSMKYNFNMSDSAVTQITKQAYAGGSKVSFKYYIPEGTVTSWWGIAWHTDPSMANNYHAGGAENPIGRIDLSKIVGAWTDIEFTLPEGGPYYLYFGSEKGDSHGRWQLDGENSYVLIDDFKVGDVTETFNSGIEESIFEEKIPGGITLGDGYVKPSISGEYAAKIVVDQIKSDAGTATFVTKEKYSAGSTVSFKYFVPTDATSAWFAVCAVDDPNDTNIYHNWAWHFDEATKGDWVTVTFTIDKDAYLHFAGSVGDWGKKDDPQTEGYILIDEFTITNGDVVVKEDFNKGLEDSIFNVNGGGISLEAGWEKLNGEFGAKIYGDKISSTATTPTFITKEAYTFTETTTVTFDYYMSGNTNSKWWILGWTNDQKTADIYAHVENNKENNDGRDLPTGVQDQWATATVEIPAGTWYFYIAMAKGEWSGGHVIVDNFQIGDIYTETFNSGIEESIFTVSPFSSHHAAIELADGYTENVTPDVPDTPVVPDAPEIGEYAAKVYVDKIGGSDGKAAFITKEKYAAGSEVSIRYYVPADVTSNWLAICGPTDAGNTSVYDNWLWQSSDYVKGAWASVTFTLKEDCYIQIGGAVGDWGNKDEPKTKGYVLFDDLTVNGEVVENFNKGLENSVFNVNTANAVELADGYVEAVVEEGEYAMKYIFGASGDVSQITKNAYPGGSKVSFRYYIPEGTTVGNWWGIAYKNTKEGISIYDAAGSSKYNLGKTIGEWVYVEFTLPEGDNYYLYFGGPMGEWKDANGGNAYVLIDDFTVGSETENFNKGLKESIFEVLVDGAVTEGEGFVPAPQGAKIMLTSISGTATTPSFITANSHSGVATVTFDCYITGNPDGKWWAFSWTNDKANANIYAFNNNDKCTENNNGKGLTTDGQDAWQTITVEIPEGEWYFFIAGEKGQWGEGYVILDNIVFKDAEGNVIATENFDEGFVVFENNRASSISLVEGKTEA